MIRLFILMFLVCANIAQAKDGQIDNLTIFTEPNLSDAVIEISRLYAKKNNIVLSSNFKSASLLIDEIDFGEPADIFIAGHRQWIESLKRKGLIDVYNIVNIAADSLVIVASNENDADFFSGLTYEPKDILNVLDKNNAHLILESEGSSIGSYNQDIFADINLASYFNVHYKVSEDKRTILDFIRRNKRYFAIVLESDLYKEEGVKIVGRVDYPNINYQAAVIAGDNMTNARKFIDFLKGDRQVSLILKEVGFAN